MKNLFLLSAVLLMGIAVSAQLKTTAICNAFVIDVLDGNVNKVEPDFTPERIKQAFPCFTSVEPENSTSACGGGVFFKDRGIFFFTGRDYIEIREKFKGRLTVPLMGAARNGLYKWLGNPKIKDVTWDAYQTSYGTLVVHFNKANKVNLLQFSKLSTDALSLCE